MFKYTRVQFRDDANAVWDRESLRTWPENLVSSFNASQVLFISVYLILIIQNSCPSFASLSIIHVILYCVSGHACFSAKESD